MPSERNAAILQSVISNPDGFLRYLLLLLDQDDPHCRYRKSTESLPGGWPVLPMARIFLCWKC
ncbi:hypothetical protein [Cronobacter sakazakii]|uniref:hypothetical protein n=1 Tax=Cronobacter sakazakii TaxID=28141 RepID=UPI003081C9EC